MNEKEKTLSQIEKNISICQKCRLFKTATHAVPGEGNVNAKLVFVGEAPGETEDKTGRPFVGRAGKLLENALNKIGYQRSDVWIGNIIKHRPPENRDPLPDEIAACEGYLAMQLKMIAPVLVVTLGRFSMNYFFPDGKITRDHGRLIKVKDYKVFPVYHPAAALRNPIMMQEFVKDFMRIPTVLKEAENMYTINEPTFAGDKNQPGLFS